MTLAPSPLGHGRPGVGSVAWVSFAEHGVILPGGQRRWLVTRVCVGRAASQVGLAHLPFHTTPHMAMLLMVLANTAGERMGQPLCRLHLREIDHVIAAMCDATAGALGGAGAATRAGLKSTADRALRIPPDATPIAV